MRKSTRGQVAPFIVMDVMEAARAAEAEGRHIIHMEVGQPATAAPKAARLALAREMEKDALGYTVSLGLPKLREGIANLYKDWYNVDLNPARVVITPGSSGAFILAFSALFDAGDKVGLGEPGYPSYRQILKAMSIDAIGLQTSPDNRYQPVPSDIPPGLAGMITASPANPSGTMLDHAALEALIAHCHAQGTSFIADEIYHGLQYEGRAISALEVSDDIYVINSFSKYFSMTGWRVGWMIVPEDHIRHVERIAQNMFICAPHASQVAAIAALDARDELDANLRTYAENRKLMTEALPAIGFGKFAPADGAFYIYCDVSDYTQDSVAFAKEILENANVAVTPGLDFDPRRGGQTLRFSYARSTEDIREGLKRLAAFMSTR
ncbi:pyridoxal phosphate-dependent aminotransferase [Aliiroseovarius lamellibrachiae]|uniref:pyridoxal phosphate-dependent aminotransferase n=1 Tax=Aliiroseovarius lamellibrachiae TaxID=1924933 RepID=UPI001BE06784|nr:aminotransferase class I/II-fold pyridoxal phosphate-dependent enzyme [Aliiroseovarius lamellibrachiae]MBT2131084.1 aminotransferase class I/II-fold pyridoxal phosphate-dependent enzyme [Aliiroseovarius lamellibrachiae]